MDLRKYAGPFDWLYSSADMIRHCLEDGFRAFLDRDQLIRSAGPGSGRGRAPGLMKALMALDSQATS